MGLPRKVFAPAFAENKTRLLFLMLVGVMVYIATFALGMEGLISAFTLTWDQSMDLRMTIELPIVDDETATPQSDKVKQIVSLVSAMPEVAKVQVLSDAQTHELLKPWINQSELLKSLPVPTLIDIDRKAQATLSAQDLRDRLKPVANTIQVDDHAVWLADLIRVVRGLMIIAGIVIALTFVAVVFAVSLLCRVVVATEHETIALLHVMGAEDDDVARHFQYHAGRLSVPAALCGYAFGIISAGALTFFLHNFADTSFLAWQHWAILGGISLLIPIMTVMIAAISARFTVMHFLDQAS